MVQQQQPVRMQRRDGRSSDVGSHPRTAPTTLQPNTSGHSRRRRKLGMTQGDTGTCANDRQGVTSEASVARLAIELALVERGYLQYRRNSIPPPIKRKKMA